MKKFYLYHNNGGIQEIKDRKTDGLNIYFDDFSTMWFYVRSEIMKYKGDNLNIQYEGYDERINKQLWYFLADITTSGKRYKQQFIARFFEDDVNERQR